jgi:CubicO group peptidase (beta-lactamase class C family)
LPTPNGGKLIISTSRKFKRGLGLIPLVLSLFVFNSGLISADAPVGQAYALQTDDTIEKLAEKFYEDPATWSVILAATRAKANESSRFRKIYDPAQLRLGDILWVPDPDEVEDLLAQEENRPKPQPFTAETLAQFRDYIETTRLRYEIPGAAVVIMKGNEIILAEGFGVREVGQNEPVTPETIFPIGSTTKAINSLMIATMADEGLLDWDQPVVDIWPGFTLSDRAHAQQMRLRDLLNMDSGLPRRDLVWSGTDLTAEELVDSLAELPLYNNVGERYYYNNQVVATGGYIAAIAAGGQYGQLRQAYVEQMQHRIFEPLAMTSATTDAAIAQANPNQATPHDINLYGQILPTPYHVDTSITPAGGVYANALDMARFLAVQMNEGVTPEGKRIVSAQNLRETHRPQTPITYQISYGMGWFIEDYRGVEVIWHDGDVLGVKALIGFLPEADLGFVILSNRILGLMFSSGLLYRLVELNYALPPETEEVYNQMWSGFQTAIIDLRTDLSPTVNPAEVAPYLGTYEDGWRIELREQHMFAVRGPYKWQILQAADGHFVVNNGYGIGITLYLESDETTDEITMSFTLPTGETGRYRQVNSD